VSAPRRLIRKGTLYRVDLEKSRLGGYRSAHTIIVNEEAQSRRHFQLEEEEEIPTAKAHRYSIFQKKFFVFFWFGLFFLIFFLVA
jgi:hypothetical protein